MLYSDSSHSAIIQPLFIGTNRLALQSTTLNGPPLNLQYPGKTLRCVAHFPRTAAFMPLSTQTSSDIYGKVSCTAYNGSAEYPSCLDGRNPYTYKGSCTINTYNGGLDKNILITKGVTTGNGLWTLPPHVFYNNYDDPLPTVTLYVVCVMTASIKNGYTPPHLCAYAWYTTGSESSASFITGKVAYSDSERTSYVYTHTEAVTISFHRVFAVCATKYAGWLDSSECIIKDMFMAFST